MQGPGQRWESGVVQRIQKARRAKNVKKYANYKQRKNLVGGLEADESVIVSSALGLPGAAAAEDQNDHVAEVKKRGRISSESEPGSEEDLEIPTNESERQLVPLLKPNHASIERNHSYVRNNARLHNPVHSRRASEPRNFHARTDRTSSDRNEPERGENRHIENNPFQKELRRRDSAREARAKQARRWAHEAAVQKKQEKNARKQRKQEAKQYRSVTRRGQPRMKHHASALLTEISKKYGVRNDPREKK